VTFATSWPGRAWQLLRGSLRRFGDDDALRLSASLAFYSIFSLAPLLVIVVAIAGLVFGDEAVSGRLARQLENFMGSQSAETIQSMVESARKPMDNVLAMVVGAATLLSGASGVFTQLRSALNRIWDVDGKPAHGWRAALVARFMSFAMVLCIGFLLIVSLVVSTLIDAFNEHYSAALPLPGGVLQAVQVAVSFVVITALFALIFRYLPETHVGWADAARGAVVTTLLFSLGKQLLGLYLARQTAKSAYGAAGSVVVILMWVYFSAITLFIGAEFIRVWTERRAPRRARREPAHGHGRAGARAAAR
jgi:membrane protein